MADLPADRYIEEALRRVRYTHTSVARVKELPRGHLAVLELARMIEKYEPTPEPIDPDLLIVREVVADRYWQCREKIMAGEWDDAACIQDALRAIKLAREKGAL